MAFFSTFFSRIFPRSGLKVKYNRLVQQQYFRVRNYYNQNSVYLDSIYNKISTDIAKAEFKHIKITRNETGETWEHLKDSDLEYITGTSANRYSTSINFWADVMREVLQGGVAVIVPLRKDGTLQALELADGYMDLTARHVLVSFNDKQVKMAREDVWIFVNPKQNLTSLLTDISRLIDDKLRNVALKLDEGNKASIKGFLRLPMNTKDEELKQEALERVNDVIDVANGTQIGYLQSNEDFLQLNIPITGIDDSELQMLLQQLYYAFGLNPKLFTCDYTEMQYRAYYESVLQVYLRMIYQEIRRKAFTKTARSQGHDLLVYLDMTNLASMKDLSDYVYKMRYMGIFSANDARKTMGMAPYDGGDIYETNANQVAIGDENPKEEVEL